MTLTHTALAEMWAAETHTIACTTRTAVRGRRMVVYIQPGSVDADRQLDLCAHHCAINGWRVVAVCRPHQPGAAVALVTGGAADEVLVAFSARSRPGDIREVAIVAGVELRYVREPVVSRDERLDLAAMYHRAGGDVELVAQLLGMSVGGLRLALARVGVRTAPAPTGQRSNESRPPARVPHRSRRTVRRQVA